MVKGWSTGKMPLGFPLMGGVQAFLDHFESISGWSLGWFAAFFLLAFVVEGWPHIQYGFWEWRMRRAAKARGGLHQDELRDFYWRQGERPEPFNLLRAIKVALLASLQMLLPVLAADLLGAENLLLGPIAAASAGFFVHSKQMQQEDDDSAKGPQIPPEAFYGFCMAMGMLLIFLLIATVLF